MRTKVTMLLFWNLVIPGHFLHADGAARTLIYNAIAAHGGEKNVSKLQIMRVKVEGTLDMGPIQTNVPCTIEDTWQMPQRYKTVSSVKFGDASMTQTTIINGDKGWVQMNGQSQEMPSDALAEFKEQKYAEDLDRLLFVKQDRYGLDLLDEIKVQGQPAVGVQVKCKGHRDVKLYFDKATGLLLKRESIIMDEPGKEVRQEVFFGDYQDKNNVKCYRKISGFRDGKKFFDGRVVEIEFYDKLDGSVFSKP